MEIINNRYKIENVYEEEPNGTVYIAKDLFESNEKILIKIFHSNKVNYKLIDFFIDNFLVLSNIKHKYITSNYSFGIINTIDNKKVRKNQYFYTKEYCGDLTLNQVLGKLNKEDTIAVINQLCDVVDYLIFRGVPYKYLNPSNVFINYTNGKIHIKLRDIATLKDMELSGAVDEYNRIFIAPELKFDKGDMKKVDLYSTGIIIYTILKGYIVNYNKEEFHNIKINIKEEIKNKLIELINGLVDKNLNRRNNNLKQIVQLFSSITNEKYLFDYKSDRQKLYLKTKIIGRDSEINKIIEINDQFNKKNFNKKILIVKGESGIGKTRLLREIEYRLRMKGEDVYFTSITEKENGELRPIVKILRQIIKDCSDNLIEKYGCELVKIIPELKFVKNIEPSALLNNDSEKLRLYDRITNFIIDKIDDRPSYIILDDLHNADNETLKLINYILKNSKDSPLLIIISYDKNKAHMKKDINQIISDWSDANEVETINLPRLNLYEAAELTKNILGIGYRPINFSTRILKETEGNPRYIEEIIKNLLAVGELFIDDTGAWETGAKNYSDIYIPTNIDEVIKKQIDLLDKDLCEIAKAVSIFSGSVSKQIISEILNIDKDRLNKLIEKLVNMKILDEMVEDWGYSYDFYNRQVKKYIYYSIDPNERVKMHETIGNLLEKLYHNNENINMEELIYHFTMSHKKEKAINYAIKLAKSMQGLLVTSHSIILWENVRKLLKNEVNVNTIEVFINLGKLYNEQGAKDKAVNIFKEALNYSLQLNKVNQTVDCKNSISAIYYQKGEIEVSEKYAKDAKKIAEEINYVDGYLESVRLLNRIYLATGNNKKVIELSKKYLKIAKEFEKNEYVAHYYNHIGIVYMFLSKIDIAKDYFEESIKYFNVAQKQLESTLPINNMGVIYGEYFNDYERAMEYFKKGLDICNKYNSTKHQVDFLINIGDLYISKHQYKEALKVMERASEIISQAQDKIRIFELYINLALVYLNLGEYDKAFEYYHLIEDMKSKYSIERQTISKYYEFLSLFYYKFGQWDESIKYCNLTIEHSMKLDLRQYLNAQSILYMNEFYKYDVFNINEINQIRLRYKNSHLISDRRENLLRFARNAIKAGMMDYAKELLDEDEKIAKTFTTKYFDIMRNSLLSYFEVDDTSIEKLFDYSRQAKLYNYLEIEVTIHTIIGNKYFNMKDYIRAAKHYIESINILYKLIKKIPNEKIRLNYAKGHGIDFLRRRLDLIKNIFVKKDMNIKHKQIKKDFMTLEEYFNFKDLQELLNRNSNFKRIILSEGKNELNYLDGLEELIRMTSANYKENLQMILEFAMQETLATRGIIFAYDEYLEKLDIIAQANINGRIPNIKQLVSIIKQRGEGIFIESSFKEHIDENIPLIFSEDIKALICIPIYKLTNSLKNKAFDMRKKRDNKNTKDVIGYMYMDTDKLLNRFDVERYKLVNTLSYLAFINIDNYYLKLTSSIDKLTGVYTRKYFDMIYTDILNKYKKGEESFSVALIDIDKFKNVNDTFGHQKGDEILKNIGSLLLSNTRETDIVARYGGEEFVIIFKDTGLDESEVVAEKIRKKVEEAQLMGPDYPLTISLGISVYPFHGEYREELIEKADQALYHAKELGRNQSVVWNNDISNSTKRLDKLAGIITGNTVQDQRNALVMVEIVELIKEPILKEEKIFKALGRLIEILAAHQGILFKMKNGVIEKIYARQRFINDWIDKPRYNKNIIDRVIKKMSGEYLIDWEDVESIDIITGSPNWQSIIVIPVINNGELKGILQLAVPIKEKEFDYNSYNFVNTIGSILATMI